MTPDREAALLKVIEEHEVMKKNAERYLKLRAEGVDAGDMFLSGPALDNFVDWLLTHKEKQDV